MINEEIKREGNKNVGRFGASLRLHYTIDKYCTAQFAPNVVFLPRQCFSNSSNLALLTWWKETFFKKNRVAPSSF